MKTCLILKIIPRNCFYGYGPQTSLRIGLKGGSTTSSRLLKTKITSTLHPYAWHGDSFKNAYELINQRIGFCVIWGTNSMLVEIWNYRKYGFFWKPASDKLQLKHIFCLKNAFNCHLQNYGKELKYWKVKSYPHRFTNKLSLVFFFLIGMVLHYIM